MKPLVLIVEDELDIALSVSKYLERAGLKTRVAHDGPSGWEVFEQFKPDLVILDLMLPGLSGLEVLRRIRDVTEIPVIALTALEKQEDRLLGFELGADDYVTKPFYPLELVSRVQAILRRAKLGTKLSGRDGLSLDLEAHTVMRQGQNLELRPTEFALLTTFLRSPGWVLNRSQLLEACTDDARDTLERTIDVHVRNLRTKLGDEHGIETVFGIGYRYAL